MKKSNIEMMLKGLNLVREALEAEMGTEVVEDAKVVDIKEAKANKDAKKSTKDTKEEILTEEEVNEATEAMEVETDALAEELNGMTLKDLKEKAKELGVAVRGSKSAIIGRILEALDNAEDDEEVVEEEEVIETDDEQDDVEVGDEVEEVDLEEALKDYSVEELAEMLTEAGLSPKGKKQALIAKVIKAVEEGKIEFGEEDEEDEVEETVDATDEEGIDLAEILSEVALKELKAICKELGIKVTIKDKTASVIEKLMEFEDDDDALMNTLIEKGIVEGVDIDEDEADEDSDEIEIEGSKERVEAVTKLYEETMEEIENEDITIDEIKEFFEELLDGNKAELKKINKMEDEDLAQKYALLIANCVDDEGEEVELNTPYMVGDRPYCCGQPMKKLKGNNYVCEIDGEEVELEA